MHHTHRVFSFVILVAFIFSLFPFAVPKAEAATPFTLALQTSCVSNVPQTKLSWTKPDGVTSFVVHKSEQRYSGWRQIATLSSATLSYTDTKVSLSKTYYYQIQAIIPDGGRHTDVGTITLPASCTIPTPVASSTSTTTPTATTTTQQQPPTTPKVLKWGAITGWRDADIQEFETRVVKNFNFLGVFAHWGNNQGFPSQYAKFAKDKGRTLVIFWEATNYNITSPLQPLFSYDTILSGYWNSYIEKFAADAKKYGGPVILIPFSEMNGDWFPWSGTLNGNTPQKSILAYRFLHSKFKGVTNVKFGWAPNSGSVPNTAGNQLEQYYPGDAYVDYVGVDGFNFGNPWLSFDQVMGDTLKRLSVYNKPIYLFSFASADGPQKAAWMKDAFEVQMPKYPLLDGWIWFNEKKERDWRVWSDDASFTVFKKVIGA